MGKILYEMVTGNEVADFPECPSWVFEDDAEAMRFQDLNPIILKAADPIPINDINPAGVCWVNWRRCCPGPSRNRSR